MNIFSEIYGAYFRAAASLLKKREKPLSEADVNEAVRKYGFRDSALFLPKRLIPQKDGSDWGLLRKTENGLVPITKNPPPVILTGLQKSWLKAKMSDPRFTLFLDDLKMEQLSKRLKNVRPLYRPEHFRYFDRFSDGDEFKNPEYRAHFKIILSAVKAHEAVRLDYSARHRAGHNVIVLPLKIEYSAKNDKFRVYCRTISNGVLRGGIKINIGRIRVIEPTGIFFTRTVTDAASMEKFFSDRRAPEPIKVLVKPERNAPERFLMEFANFAKRTWRDPESGCLIVKIYYDRADETELLIQLLSFGAAVEILSPREFREQAAKRVKQQAQLLNIFNHDIR